MTSAVPLDTVIHEPSFTADEAEMIVFALDRTRATFAWKVGGLDDEALHRAHPPSQMTLAWLIKHLAWVEDWRAARWIAGEPMPDPWRSDDGDSAEQEWQNAADDSAETLYALYAAAVGRSRKAIDDALSRGGLDQPSPMSFGGESPNLRRVLTDLHDEMARHLGHADLFRESIDGRVGEDPPPP